MKLTFHKVTAIPSGPALEPNAIYIVSTGAPEAELYVTGTVPTDVRRLPTTADIQAMIDSSVGSGSAFEIVPDISARDALGLSANTLVLVTDASADPAVNAGAATYAYNAATDSFTKISEFESLDVVLQWSNIIGGPTSTPADIDNAVQLRHTHANKTQLDKIGEDANGCLTYDGALPATGWETTGW